MRSTWIYVWTNRYLRYIRDRVNVPRDMSIFAAKYFRTSLEATVSSLPLTLSPFNSAEPPPTTTAYTHPHVQRQNWMGIMPTGKLLKTFVGTRILKGFTWSLRTKRHSSCSEPRSYLKRFAVFVHNFDVSWYTSCLLPKARWPNLKKN